MEGGALEDGGRATLGRQRGGSVGDTPGRQMATMNGVMYSP